MFNNKTLTYISLFSSAGVGCYGFKQEQYECIASNEIIPKRLEIQKFNSKCRFESGYILGDIKKEETKFKIFQEIERYKQLGNDGVDVLIATPPCQGMSVANHKKSINEIVRNSLVVESILLTKKIKPKFFIFENVSAFLSTGCTSPNGQIKTIQNVINEELLLSYEIKSKIINFKNYGSNSSRTRTLVIGVRKDLEEFISPLELFPNYSSEKKLKEVIGFLPSLEWGEISNDDILHAFRTYPKEMESWIEFLKQGECAFDNTEPRRRPHRVINGVMLPNVRKNGGKYTRQFWEKVGPCIHTRNDQLASQNTIHPKENRVFSIRELMLMMTIPCEFKWTKDNYDDLNKLSIHDKRNFYKLNEINIRQSIGESVPTNVFRQIAANIKREYLSNNFKLNIGKIIQDHNLTEFCRLKKYIKENRSNFSNTILSKIAELANTKRIQNDAYYTNKSLLNSIYDQLPDADSDEINILEPSVGVGNFLPFLFKKYEEVSIVNIDVVDVDNNSLEILKTLFTHIYIPKNVKLTFINMNFLLFSPEKKYFLTVGNPPFTKVKKRENPECFLDLYNDDTSNLAAIFLEKSLSISEYVVMIEPKFIINTAEFKKTRDFLSSKRILSITDFGEKGFKGVLIETVCLAVKSNEQPSTKSKTKIKHITLNIEKDTFQNTLTSDIYPYWILYRDSFFEKVASSLHFDVFSVFRDRQIFNSDLTDKKDNESIRVLKAKNIADDGKIVNIKGYDRYIKENVLKLKKVYKYFNDTSVYLVPNMTYKPRMIRNPRNVTVNGSLAVLVPKSEDVVLTDDQIRYFSSDEYRHFYQIARNYQTRSLNIDEMSVFFFGLKLK